MTTLVGTSVRSELIGQLKIGTVVLGIIDLGLTASAYARGNGSEEYFLSMICIALILSILFVVGIIFDIIPVNGVWKFVHMIYHGVIGCLLLIGAFVMLISLLSHWNTSQWNKGKTATRFFAIIFGVFNSAVYAYISYGIHKSEAT